MSALRTCPGCGARRILLPTRTGVRTCVDCRDQAQGRLFGLEATLEDLDEVDSGAIAPEAARERAPTHAPGCRCDRPLTDDEGGCVRCGRWAVA